jgi:hypothetical protein
LKQYTAGASSWKRRHQERIEYVGRWAAKQGGTDEAVRVASYFFGHGLPEISESIRRCMPSAEPFAAPDPATCFVFHCSPVARVGRWSLGRAGELDVRPQRQRTARMADSEEAALARCHTFVQQVTVTGEVWGLKSAKGWANCDSGLQPGATVMPFWSSKATADAAARGEWSVYQPTAIPLDLFVVRWLTNMASEGALVGPDWEPEQLGGYEIAAADMRDRLLDILGL